MRLIALDRVAHILVLSVVAVAILLLDYILVGFGHGATNPHANFVPSVAIVHHAGNRFVGPLWSPVGAH
jgi:hypothetical protein